MDLQRGQKTSRHDFNAAIKQSCSAIGRELMKKRPFSVTIIGWIFVATGVVGFGFHASEIRAHPFEYDVVWVLGLSLLAAVSGVCMLMGSNSARWLAVAWLAFHVGVSAFHSRRELIVHSVLLVVMTYFLFRSEATRYFRGTRGVTGEK
jgi:hypothetical protein